jgi:hypothetical protein
VRLSRQPFIVRAALFIGIPPWACAIFALATARDTGFGYFAAFADSFATAAFVAFLLLAIAAFFLGSPTVAAIARSPQNTGEAEQDELRPDYRALVRSDQALAVMSALAILVIGMALSVAT